MDRRAERSAYLLKAAELALRARDGRQALALLDEVDSNELTANERADAHRLRGLAQFALGRRSQAVRTLQEAAAMAPGDDPDLNAAIYVEIGFALGEEELFNASVDANLRAPALVGAIASCRPGPEGPRSDQHRE